MSLLPLSLIVNVSVGQAPAGIGQFNVNNLLLLSGDTPSLSPSGGFTIYLTPEQVATDYGSTSQTALMANEIFAQSPNLLAGRGQLIIAPLTSAGAELALAAIQRLQPLVSFCGILKTNSYVANELHDAAVYVQTQNMILFAQSATASDATVTTGLFWQIMNAGLTQTRCLMYLDSDYAHASLMAAAYAGRALSTDFSGSNTTQDMQLKSLAGINADSGMTLTIYNACQVAGVDVYPSVQGVAKVLTSGKNRFFDQVYNQMWFTTNLQTTVFNAMATTPTKVPQTEQGMTLLKSAAQQVCEQAKANLYVAPGSWSGGTFGNQQDFIRNITDVGYYVYTTPISKQSQSDRAARIAPLMQIAIKEAGAVDSASILVNITA